MTKQSKTLVNNTIMMYLMTIAKLVVPLISLPYLTRVLSVDCYGTVSFVKSLMSYFQIFIDFHVFTMYHRFTSSPRGRPLPEIAAADLA